MKTTLKQALKIKENVSLTLETLTDRLSSKSNTIRIDDMLEHTRHDLLKIIEKIEKLIFIKF